MVNTSDVKLPVLLIDLSSLYWQAFHATANEIASAAKENTLNAVRRCTKDGDWLVAICCDVGRSFRKDLSPAYKAHREKAQEAAYAELDRTKERLKADGFLLWGAEGFEADDVIATACDRALKAGHFVRVASADKDLAQLICGAVDQLKTHTWDVMTQADLFTKYGVLPDQFGDFLALTGDKSDGIEGAPGIGPVRAKELLTTWGSWSLIKRKLEKGDLPGSTPAVFKSLSENIAKIDLAKQLVTLRTDAPINFDEIYERRDMKPLTEVDLSDIDEPEDSISEGPKEKTPAECASVTEERSLATGPHPGEPVALVAAPASAPAEFTHQLEPRSFKELVIGCQILFNGRIYQKYPTHESMVAAGLRGREMGYGLGAALDAFHCMDVRGVRSLALHAHVIIDRAMRDPDCEYVECVESTSEQATYEAKRRSRPKPFSLTYTIGQARDAGLVKPDGNWAKRPAEMLRKTCGVQTCRVVFPGAAMGLYCIEELES